jgi:hypothetical protein
VRDKGLVGSRREKVLRRVSSDQVRDQLGGEIVDHYLVLTTWSAGPSSSATPPVLSQTGMWMVRYII